MSRLASSCAFSSAVYLLPACIVTGRVVAEDAVDGERDGPKQAARINVLPGVSSTWLFRPSSGPRSYPVGGVHFVSYHDRCPNTNSNICTEQRKIRGFSALLLACPKTERLIMYYHRNKIHRHCGRCFNSTSVVWCRTVQTVTMITKISTFLLN